jgi:hypothetical protein
LGDPTQGKSTVGARRHELDLKYVADFPSGMGACLTAATPGSTTHLIHRFAGGALGVFELPLAAALLAEIAPVEQFILDLFHRPTAPGGALGPRHISAMKITDIRGIYVKLP